jgi:hypothetical protein
MRQPNRTRRSGTNNGKYQRLIELHFRIAGIRYRITQRPAYVCFRSGPLLVTHHRNQRGVEIYLAIGLEYWQRRRIATILDTYTPNEWGVWKLADCVSLVGILESLGPALTSNN